MPRRALAIAAAIAAAASAGAARADAGGAADFLGRDLVLDAATVAADAVLELSLSRRQVYEPASLAPDLYYGVTAELTVGVIHSARATGVVDAGDGLCFRGSAHGCPRAYANTGVDVRYAVRRGTLAIAARLRAIVADVDPWKPSLRPGAVIRWRRGRVGVMAEPQLQLGLANRDRGNRDWLRIPVWLGVQPARRVALALRLGIDGELATFGDTYQLPVGAEATVRATDRLDVSVFAGFPSLGGPQNRFTIRVAWIAIGGRWR